MDNSKFRIERIEKLLYELKYEISRGMLEREIDETISFKFIVPRSMQIPDGIVKCVFITRPIHRIEAIGLDDYKAEPKLKLIKND